VQAAAGLVPTSFHLSRHSPHRVMASVVDTLITHPNVMNAASLYWPQPGMLYTEGFALDEFCAGRWGLLPVREKGHRIGLILDSGMSKRQHSLHLQVRFLFSYLCQLQLRALPGDLSHTRECFLCRLQMPAGPLWASMWQPMRLQRILSV
jgi:hypothetical protein